MVRFARRVTGGSTSARATVSRLPAAILLAVSLGFSCVVFAATANDLSYCGGFGQRACCLNEAIPSCNTGLSETGAIGGKCGGILSDFDAGICGYANPNSLSHCGGDGQRACCVGETHAGQACNTGNTELIGRVAGQCASPALFPGANAATCWTPTPCGGEGQRACIATEQVPSCNAGLIELGGCDDLSCGRSSGWCYRPTACGGPGQRACCTLLDVAGDVNQCQTDLVPLHGASGDFSCGIGDLVGGGTHSFHTCVSRSALTTPIPEPNPGWSPNGADTQSCELRGYADLHGHLFAHLGHGGGVLAGTPNSDDGINDALRQDFGTYLDLVTKDGSNLPVATCDSTLAPDCGKPGFVEFHKDHMLGEHALGAGTREGLPQDVGFKGANSNFGAPLFNGWPTWRSTTHQQMYHTWLERAWRGGLRLMVNFAVTNEALCTSSKRLRDTDCEDEMGPVDAQLDATWAFQTMIDDLAGGDGLGWFRVVTTPVQARDVIRDGKLAVVLGIEVANLFNCKPSGCAGKNAGESDEAFITRMVDEYYDKGVRVVFPIHNFDNAFGGPATWQDAIHAGNYASTGSWWAAEACPDSYGFTFSGFTSFIISLFGFGQAVVPPTHPFATCNKRGLTPLGEYMIRYMMAKGIVIDVDHMSNHALEHTLNIAEELGMPVIASHVQFYELNREAGRHERMRTRAQLERIRDGGGMIAAMLKDDKQDTDDVGGQHHLPYTSSPTGKVIADNCRHSSKTWAQMYQYAVDVMQGPVAMGSDFNGVAGHVGPRFGFDACGQNNIERSKQARAGNQLAYPFVLPGFGTFSKQVTGLKTFDFNVDGLAHVGLLPDLVADLGKIGLTNAELDPLMRSAEGFVSVWERAEGLSVPGNGVSVLGCQAVALAADANCKAWGSVADARTAADFTLLTQSPPGPYSLGVTSVTLSTVETDACSVQPTPCLSTVTVLDQTAPPISCPPAVVQECGGEATVVSFGSPVAGADNCGTSVLTGCDAASGQLFPLGATPVTCGVQDNALPSPNVNSCGFVVTVQDTTPPDINCPTDIVRECTGNGGTNVTPGAATALDICGGVSVSSHAAAHFLVGSTTLTYQATDDVGLMASCTSKIVVQDTTAPVVTGSAASPNLLWPPDNSMVPVSVAVDSMDVCDSTPASCRITGVRTNEPLDGVGYDHVEPTWTITGALSVNLRAARSGRLPGRVYTIDLACEDGAGNVTSATAQVHVPHNM
jgi:microsomal dipeptidase-like Zn-dependent dipeptidase